MITTTITQLTDAVGLLMQEVKILNKNLHMCCSGNILSVSGCFVALISCQNNEGCHRSVHGHFSNCRLEAGYSSTVCHNLWFLCKIRMIVIHNDEF
jgi:hypothetical protein